MFLKYDLSVARVDANRSDSSIHFGPISPTLLGESRSKQGTTMATAAVNTAMPWRPETRKTIEQSSKCTLLGARRAGVQ